MLKLIALTLCLLASFSSYANVEQLMSTQQQLNANLKELDQAHESEKPFLEDVLNRKNTQLREQIAVLDSTKTDTKALNELYLSQVALLQGLIELNTTTIDGLTKQARNSDSDQKLDLELEVQHRIGVMDSYYDQLHQTLLIAEKNGVNVNKHNDALVEEMSRRMEFLSNANLYIDAQKQKSESRISYVTDDEKIAISQDVVRLSERITMMVASLEASIALVEEMGVDATQYKQLLVNTTGDINADVLDVGVAFGLFEQWLESFKNWGFENTPSIVVKGLLFFFILYMTKNISRVVGRGVKKSVKHSQMDFSVLMQDFFVSIASKAVIFVGLLFALSQIGIELGPLLTGFGVAGVIIGFALQDTLSNFASGLMILIYRPYDVGDLVKVAGIQGSVNNMSLVSTTVQTIDNQRLVIPNNKIWGDVINNITAEQVRRVDMTFGIGYSDDIDKAKRIFNEILDADERILKEPESMVKLHTLNESSVDFIVRPWVNTDDYWDVYWDVTEQVKKRLDEEKISIPFPQRDVHIYQHNDVAKTGDENNVTNLVREMVK
ncbi:mechanosensitive ion channel family protein [uncultured Vibrio sp.]|uniref:mechanosensitive ion channel family protein n=1 Tax=uncultured Vibrio sp. TaxID=114054 RepID=UPI0025F5D00E|nr:mechanosensitive ion channel family protein [uncultured Vibrio sp.]